MACKPEEITACAPWLTKWRNSRGRLIRNKRPQPHTATPVAQLLTIAQVAALLCVHRTRVYDLINCYGLPVMKLGRRSTRIHAVRLQQW